MYPRMCRLPGLVTFFLTLLFLLPVRASYATSALSVNNVSVLVGPSANVKANFQVTLSSPASVPVTVAYSTQDGSAHAGVDYTATSGNLSLATGVITTTIAVPVLAGGTAASGSTFTLVLSSATNASISNSTGTCTITRDATPTAISLTPSVAASLVNQPLVLSTVVSCTGGQANFNQVGLVIGPLASPATSLYVKYAVSTNSLYLANSSGTYIGGFAPGSANVISTTLGSLNCAATTVSYSGNNLTVNWSLSAGSGLLGAQPVYANVSDKIGLSSGYQKLGTWTVSPDVAPVAVSVTPSRPLSLVNYPEPLTTTVSSAGGAHNLNQVGLAIGENEVLGNPTTTLYLKYVAGTNLLYATNASGTYLGGFAPGTNNVITTPLGALNCASTTVNFSGNQLIIQWSITPATALSTPGTEVFLLASDLEGLNSGWQSMTYWAIVTQDSPPSNLSVSPLPLNTLVNAPGILTSACTTVAGNFGVQNISLSVGNSSTSNTSLHAVYSQVNGLGLFYLLDANGNSVGGYPAGSNHVITTTLGSLNCANTSVSVSNNNETVTIQWSLTPAASFLGAQSVFMDVTDIAGETSGWSNYGTWTISQEAAPVAVAISPATLDTPYDTQEFVGATVSSAGGAGNLGSLAICVGNVGDPATAALYAKYQVTTNLLYLYDTTGTYIGGFAPGSNNVITTPEGSLNCAATVVYPLGTGVAVNFALSPTFLGTKSISLIGSDIRGLNSGWVKEGTWVVSGNGIYGTVTVNGAPAVGVQVKLTGGLKAGVVTDSTGKYGFAPLLPGSYTVTVTAQNGVIYQNPSVGITMQTGNTGNATINFAGGTPYTISGHVLQYANGGATSGISGVTVAATGTLNSPASWYSFTSGNGPAASVLTDANGAYSLTLPWGTYQVVVSSSNGPVMTSGYQVTVPVTGTSGPNATQDFPEYEVSGTVTLNGQLTAGIPVTLTNAFNASLNVSTTTDSNGHYQFLAVAATQYSVIAGQVPGYLYTYSNGAAPIQCTLPTSGITGVSPNATANFTGTGGASPANDNFANAQVISGASGSVSGTTLYSTLQPGEPYYNSYDKYGSAVEDSVWYKYTMPAGATSGVSFSSGGEIIQIYSGTSLGNLQVVSSAGNSVNLTGTPGSTYYVQVGDLSFEGPTEQGPFTLTWAPTS